jgi:WD40 repeat protein
VAFAPDGRHLASASFDHTLRVWDTASGEALCTCKGHTDKVTALAYRPDGKLLASAGLDRAVRLWDAATGKRRLVLSVKERSIQALAFTPDGQFLLLAGDSGTVEVIDLPTRRPVRRLELSSKPLYALALSPDGRTFAAAGEDGKVHIASRITGDRLQTLPSAAGGCVFSLAFAPDGDCLLTGEEAGAVCLWDVEKGKLMATHEQHAGAVSQVIFGGDGRRIVSTGADGQVLIRDTATGSVLHSHRFPGKVLCATIAPDGRLVGTGTGKSVCYLMELPRRAR